MRYIDRAQEYSKRELSKSTSTISEREGEETLQSQSKIVDDPFYLESNMRYLKNIMQEIKEGKAHFVEHDLIE